MSALEKFICFAAGLVALSAVVTAWAARREMRKEAMSEELEHCGGIKDCRATWAELAALREAGDRLADAAVRILGTRLQDEDYPRAYAKAVCDFGDALVAWQALRGQATQTRGD